MTIITDDLKDMRINIIFSFALILFVLVCLMLPSMALPASFGQSHETHWWDDRGPNFWSTFPNPPMGCTNCHYDDTPHHGNPYQFADMQDFANTTVCDDCHSKNGAYDGVAMAKANWDSGIYTGDNLEYLPAGKEQWCATCHDDAAPTINGVAGKNVGGDDTSYGYFISGHGKYNVTCTECHDPRLIHFDGYDNSYAGTGNYREGFRLMQISGNNPMLIPRLTAYNANQFRLCYSCHDESAVINRNPLLTNFADIPASSNQNLHDTHLKFTNLWWDSDLSGEPGGMKDSYISCPACHNPHGKDYNNQATISMTRQDLGIVHKRDVTGLFGYFESGEWGNLGGDLNCFQMCHQNPGPNFKYYYHLGTRPPETPRFWTKLNSQTDVTNPTYGTGGNFLGGTFTSYDRYGVTETGLSITSSNQGCQFPASNINSNDDYYGETIEFWYVPNFNFNGNTTTKFLFDYYDPADPDNFIRIGVVPITGGYSGLEFRIRENIGVTETHRLATDPLYWTAGSVHHIVCTWGPAQGMRMYLDRTEPDYLTSDGLNFYGGVNQTAANFYIGRRYDGALPASGIIDDFKIYGYQYQKFEGDITLFSKMGSAVEITTPIKGNGGGIGGSVNYVTGQQGYGTQFSATYNGVVNFPTTNLNPVEDTIDLWYDPSFNIEDNTNATKHLFWYNIDASNNTFIKVDADTIDFTIIENGNSHILKTTGLENWDWYHIVCTWGPDGMHIYINDKEADYSDNSGLSYTGGLPTTGMPVNFRIGNKTSGGNSYCDGIIDELRVYGYQGSPSYLEFLAECPVDIQVIDPLGRIIDRFQNEIQGAQYLEQDFNHDGEPDDKIIAPKRNGTYTFSVFPEPGANPEDTYTLKVSDGENIIILVKDEPVENISGENITYITVTSSGLKFIKLLSPDDNQLLSGHVPFDWENVGYDGFKLQFSADNNFKRNGISLPNQKWTWLPDTIYTPTDKEWKNIKKLGRKGRNIYWRVTGIDAEGNIGSSQTRSFILSHD